MNIQDDKYYLIDMLLCDELENEGEFLEALDYICDNASRLGRRETYQISRYLHSASLLNVDFKQEGIDNMMKKLKEKGDKLSNNKNVLKTEMMRRMPERFHMQYGDDEPDIVHCIPLERHIRGLDDEHDMWFDSRTTYFHIINNMTTCREMTRKTFNYISSYLCKLTINMQYLKSQIIKLEFANQFDFEKVVTGEKTSVYVRKGRYSGTSLDSILNFHMDNYMELNKEFRKYIHELGRCKVDSEMMRYEMYPQITAVMDYFYNMKLSRDYKLPFSVMEEKGGKYKSILKSKK